MIFPMVRQVERTVRHALAVDVTPQTRGPVGRYRATVELDCTHVFEVDYLYDTSALTSRARARSQAVALTIETSIVCPRCLL